MRGVIAAWWKTLGSFLRRFEDCPGSSKWDPLDASIAHLEALLDAFFIAKHGPCSAQASTSQTSRYNQRIEADKSIGIKRCPAFSEYRK